MRWLALPASAVSLFQHPARRLSALLFQRNLSTCSSVFQCITLKRLVQTGRGLVNIHILPVLQPVVGQGGQNRAAAVAAPIGGLLRLPADAHCPYVPDGVQAGTCTPAWPPPARPLAPAAACRPAHYPQPQDRGLDGQMGACDGHSGVGGVSVLRLNSSG